MNTIALYQQRNNIPSTLHTSLQTVQNIIKYSTSEPSAQLLQRMQSSCDNIAVQHARHHDSKMYTTAATVTDNKQHIVASSCKLSRHKGLWFNLVPPYRRKC